MGGHEGREMVNKRSITSPDRETKEVVSRSRCEQGRREVNGR